MTEQEIYDETNKVVDKIAKAIDGEKTNTVVLALIHCVREVISKHLELSELVNALDEFKLGLIRGIIDGPQNSQTT